MRERWYDGLYLGRVDETDEANVLCTNGKVVKTRSVLPKPETLGESTKGNTNIGCIATGEALDGSGEKTFYINNICSHEAAFEETGNQAVSYTTGVPAMIGSAMMVQNIWDKKGVVNTEEMDPDPFMQMLGEHGLPWQVKELDGPVGF